MHLDVVWERAEAVVLHEPARREQPPRVCIGGSGRIAFDYDMKIAEPFAAPDGGTAGDSWPAFRALAGKPLLILRGELSDLLAPATVERMLAEAPGAEAVTVPRVGHPPTLAEPEAQAAVSRWLGRIA